MSDSEVISEPYAERVVLEGPESFLSASIPTLPVGRWVTVTQGMVDGFADSTDDHQWIHVDPVRAAVGPFGGPIAHGYLTLSLVGPLLADILEVRNTGAVLNYGLEKVRFPAPVRVGARIRLEPSVDSVVAIAGGVQVGFRCAVTIEDSDKPACVAGVVYRYLS